MRKKGKRAHLKRFASDYINVSQRPRALIMDSTDSEGTYPRRDWYCQSCGTLNFKKGPWAQGPAKCIKCGEYWKGVSRDHWLNYHGRSRSVVGPPNDKTLIRNNTWTKEIPETIGRVHHSYYAEDGSIIHAEETPKEIIKSNLRKSGSTIDRLRRQWVSTDGRGHGIDDFYPIVLSNKEGEKLKLFFSGTKFCFVEEHHGVCKISIIYRGKDRAMKAWWDGRVIWVETFKLESSSTQAE